MTAERSKSRLRIQGFKFKAYGRAFRPLPLQVHGALLEALNAAAQPVKAELATVALPPSKVGTPGPCFLTSALLLFGTLLLGTALTVLSANA